MSPVLLVVITTFPMLFETYNTGQNFWKKVTKSSKIGES